MREKVLELYYVLKNKKVRKGGSGFLVYAKHGELFATSGGTGYATTVELSRITVTAGVYHFDQPGFNREDFMEDCICAVNESLKLSGLRK